MSASFYMPIPAVIERIEDETPDIKTFTIRPVEPISFAAGQFVELAVPGIGEAPFTPSSSPKISDNMEITGCTTCRKVTNSVYAVRWGAPIRSKNSMAVKY